MQSDAISEPAGLVRLGPHGFWTITLTLFVVAYNLSVLPAIMPAIVHDFQSSMGFIQSVLVLFSLVTASFAPTAENLCRYFGRTKVFLTSLVVYGIGIAAAALSPGMGMLAASFVVLAGLGAASLVSTPWTLADLAFGGKIDPRVAVALSVATTLGVSVGALAGGFLASSVGWRWSFAPSLAILAVVLAFSRELPKLHVSSNQPIDWIGGLLSFFGFGSILLGLSLGGEFGWWEPRREFSILGVVLPPFAVSIVPTLLAAGAIALGLFLFWQRRAARRQQASIMRVGLLRKRVFVCGTLTAMMHTLVVTGIQFNLFQFFPIALGLNPFRTALAIVPYPLTVTVVTVAAKYFKLSDRMAPKNVVFLGLWLVAAGLMLMFARVHSNVQALDVLPGLVVMGIGSGIFLSAIVDLSYAVASSEEKPEGSAIFNPVQNLGNSLGRAILGTLFVFAASRGIVDGILRDLGQTISIDERRQMIFQLQEMIQTMPRSDVIAAIVGRLPAMVQPLVYPIELDATTYGMRISLLAGLALMGGCFLLARTLPQFPRSLPAAAPATEELSAGAGSVAP